MGHCRNCNAELSVVFCDLGAQPLANAYLTEEQLSEPETFYPLRPLVCEKCLLVQVPEFAPPERIFRDYAYFSGQSRPWRDHCESYVQDVVSRDAPGRVLEIASNDGTLLKQAAAHGLAVLGIEPARNVTWRAQLDGIPTISEFFGVDLARQLAEWQPDWIVANNVLAHVPDLNDFLGGIRLLLPAEGVVTFEVPHVARLIEQNTFDTIYHEHFSYFSLYSLRTVLGDRGLRIFDVQQQSIHGGSLRVFACHQRARTHDTQPAPAGLLRWEQANGYTDLATYADYAGAPRREKIASLKMIAGLQGTVAGYGAAAKLNTFLNYCGLGPESVSFVVDSTPTKQGTFLPGSRIPVRAPEELAEHQPGTILVGPWNWRDEIERKIRRDCPWEPTVICRPFA